jgi:uracil-DNA glycosylase
VTRTRPLATPEKADDRPLERAEADLVSTRAAFEELAGHIVNCELCPRLRTYCAEIARVRRRAYADHVYWGKPVPSFGDPNARVLALGLAPGADDDMRLLGLRITSVVRCAPPANKPLPAEIKNCATFVDREIAILKDLRVVVCLGKIAFDGYLAHLLRAGKISSRKGLVFRHGVEYAVPNSPHILATYHPSLQNTNTGLLTQEMLQRVFERARMLAGLPILKNQ